MFSCSAVIEGFVGKRQSPTKVKRRDGRNPGEQRIYLSLIPSDQPPPGLHISPAQGSHSQTFMQKSEVMGNHTKIPFFWGDFFNTFYTNPSTEVPPGPFLQGAARVKGMKRKQEAETQPLMGISVTWKKKLVFFWLCPPVTEVRR